MKVGDIGGLPTFVAVTLITQASVDTLKTERDKVVVVSLCRPFHPHTVLGQHRQEEGQDISFAEPGEHTDTRRQNEREWRQQW